MMSDYPIPYHETWDIKDSSKIQTYMDCPRRYFYQYMLGWRKVGGGLHLNFGGALHASMEHFNLLRKKNGRGYRLTDEDIADAYFMFLEIYRKDHAPEDDNLNRPKDPDTARCALAAYAQEFDLEDSDEDILYTEKAGRVMVDAGRFLHFKMDLIKRDERGIAPRDYKTGSRNSEQWLNQWELKTQIGTYIHAAKCLFPNEPVWGLEVRGIFLYKAVDQKRKYGNVDFIDVPIRKDRAMMEVWRSNVIRWMDAINTETFELSARCDLNDPVMNSFPLNTESCTKYSGCPYLDFCKVWPNPLSRCHEVPMDFEIRWWNPSQEDGRDVPNKEEVML